MRMGLSGGHRRRWIIVLAVFAFCAYFVLTRLQPSFISAAKEAANRVVVETIHKDMDKILQDYGSEDFYTVDGDTFISNTSRINRLKSQIINTLGKSLNESETVKIPLGSVSKIYILNGLGPSIPVKISPHRTIEANFEDSFEDAGINFVKHTMYLKISVDVTYRGFLMNESETVTTDIPIIENVTSGKVPEYYGGNIGVMKN